MAQTYDAVVIGAGHNGLTCACYLAKAGLQVLVLEQYHRIGGMTLTEEVTLPGFRSDVHAYGYQLANLSPTPHELQLAALGFALIRPEPVFVHAFPDGEMIAFSNDLEKTVQSIARYSQRDAQTWRMLFGAYQAMKPQVIGALFAPPMAFTAQAAQFEQLPGGMDLYRASLQSARSWCDELFESEEMKTLMAAWPMHAGVGPDDGGGANLAFLFVAVMQDLGNNLVQGGMHHLTHALARYLQQHGGAIRTNARVNRILVEDGRAVAVRLDDGEEIQVRGLVASNVDPQQLTLTLLGEAQVGAEITRKMQRYELGDAYLGIYLALDGAVEWQAGPEAGTAGYVHPTPASLESLAQVYVECRAGRLPAAPLLIVGNDSRIDPSRAPAGKHVMKILVANVPYDIKGDATGKISSRHWDAVKEPYADHLLDLLTETYLPDLKSRLLRRVVYSPLDYERGISTSVRGTIVHGAFKPYQLNAMRPIPELGHYRSPVANVYLCGAGSHPGPGVSMAPGRNAAQVICGDLGIDFNRLVTSV